MKQQQTKPKRVPIRSAQLNELGFPVSVAIQGTLLGFQFLAPITRDGIYTGTNAKGEQIHAIVCNSNTHEHQAAFINRGG